MVAVKAVNSKRARTVPVVVSCPQTVVVEKGISILPTDYEGLNNLPSINGVTLIGEKTGSELSLLSSISSDYETVSLLDAGKKAAFVVVLREDDGKAQKVPLIDFTQSVSGFSTNEKINPDVAVGAYQFVEVKQGE